MSIKIKTIVKVEKREEKKFRLSCTTTESYNIGCEHGYNSGQDSVAERKIGLDVGKIMEIINNWELPMNNEVDHSKMKPLREVIGSYYCDELAQVLKAKEGEIIREER